MGVKIRYSCVALLLSVGLLNVGYASDLPEGPAALDYMVEMRDGVRLATTVYIPAGTGPWPTILSRTPYDKEGFKARHVKYTDNVYAFVAQDVRGKFASEGQYVPFASAREDGYDTIEWIGSQLFCNGRIGMTGGSALGITTNLAASADPPGLMAAYVVVAPQTQFNQSTFINGVFKWSQVGGWMERQGAGDLVAPIRARPVFDAGWKRTDFINHIGNVDIPMYNVGGWFDIFLQGNVDNFVALQNDGKRGAIGNQKLLMGPFGHGQISGDLEFQNGGRDAWSGEEIRWFDYWLKGADNGIMGEPPVTYYMMASARKGAISEKNRWVKHDRWPPESTKLRYYLQDGFGLSSSRPETDESSTAYHFDPRWPVPTFGGSNLLIKKGPMDQRAVGERDDYLRFQTDVLEEDVVVAGPVLMELWVSTNGPDTDFMVKLIDVYPDGYEALILDNPIRARFRHGRNPGDEKMMTPGVPEKLEIDLWSTAITFEKGHRIAVHVASSNYPRFDVNPNTGVPAMKPRVATNTIYHDASRPSAIVLPLLED